MRWQRTGSEDTEMKAFCTLTEVLTKTHAELV